MEINIFFSKIFVKKIKNDMKPLYTNSQLEIIETFSFFDDWHQKYEYLISLGKKIKFPIEEKKDFNLIKGCESQVWMISYHKNEKLFFNGISDSVIVSGLIAILLKIYSGQRAKDILNMSLDFIKKIDLATHLSPNRKNGLFEMINSIKKTAYKNYILYYQ